MSITSVVAFRRCTELGANQIICHPFFLSNGRHVQEDIPALMQSAATKYPGVTYCITKPLGVQDKIIELIYSSILAEGLNM